MFSIQYLLNFTVYERLVYAVDYVEKNCTGPDL
jgi:hypothetical protein